MSREEHLNLVLSVILLSHSGSTHHLLLVTTKPDSINHIVCGARLVSAGCRAALMHQPTG